MKRRTLLGFIAATSGCQTVRYAQPEENATLKPPLENYNLEFVWSDTTPDKIAEGMLYGNLRDTSEELENRIMKAIEEDKIRVKDERRALRWPWTTMYVNRKDSYWEISERRLSREQNTWSVTAIKVGDTFPEYLAKVFEEAVWHVRADNITKDEQSTLEDLQETGSVEYDGEVPDHVASLRNRLIDNAIVSPSNEYYAEYQNQSGEIRIRKSAPPAKDAGSFENNTQS